jgi:predicted RNA binding protein YcfA (HicA-like mRNA interferase family)
MNKRKLLQKIIAGSKNIKFAEMLNLFKGFGFEVSRTDSSHHIFVQPLKIFKKVKVSEL